MGGARQGGMSGVHTPGPWRYDVESEAVFYDDGNICPNIAFLNENTSGEQNLADARLIAAAPDLLEALRAVDLFSAKPPSGEVSAQISRAIARATGTHP